MMEMVRHENRWPFGEEVAFVRNDGKGYVMVSFEGYTFGFIHDLVVHDTARRQGTGRKLLSLAEDETVARGLERAVLRVEPGSWMEDWYRRNGYEDFAGPGVPVVNGYVTLIKNLNR